MIKNEVTNKELSIKLKEAGFEQESEFYWGIAKTFDKELQLFMKVNHVKEK